MFEAEWIGVTGLMLFAVLGTIMSLTPSVRKLDGAVTALRGSAVVFMLIALGIAGSLLQGS